MKKSTKILTAAALTLGLVGAVAAYKGDGFRHQGWHNGEHFIAHVRDELDLTPEQTAALQAISDQLQDIRKTVKQDHAVRTQALLAVVEGDVFDQSAAMALVHEKTALVDKYAPQVIASVAAFYDGLSAQQQAEVREHISRRMQRHGHD